jgi:pimeloyl-ACP methyl ester carboxylesterase
VQLLLEIPMKLRPALCSLAVGSAVFGLDACVFGHPTHAASLADGTWVVEEKCGEYSAARDPNQRRGFERQIEMLAQAGSLTGHKSLVSASDGSVTDTAYQGSIMGPVIEITGKGTRSNLDRPWTYVYRGSVAGDGRAELTGAMMMRVGNSNQATQIRSCTLTFLARRDGQLPAPASAQSLGDLVKLRTAMRTEFQSECRAQLAAGKASNNVPAAEVDACVLEKRRGVARAVAQGPPASASELKLEEFAPWLIKANSGPAKAKGLIYFVAGYRAPNNYDAFRFAPYLLKSLTDSGWDLVAARIPDRETPLEGQGLASDFQVPGAAAFVLRRLLELKAQGYRHIVLAGFSWGAWTAMVAAQSADFPADALIIDAPNVFGRRDVDNMPNPFFDLNIAAFPPIVGKIRTPGIFNFPNDPFFEPDAIARGAIAEKHFEDSHLARLVIAAPPGFTGHYAGWLPFFDFAFGKCIGAFLDQPNSKPCRLPPIANDDFRSILEMKQVPDAQSRRIASSDPLVGRKFAAYTLNDEDFKHFDFVSARERATLESQKEFREPIEFRNGELCASGRCSILVRWSDNEILEFDPGSGKLKALWIADS